MEYQEVLDQNIQLYHPSTCHAVLRILTDLAVVKSRCQKKKNNFSAHRGKSLLLFFLSSCRLDIAFAVVNLARRCGLLLLDLWENIKGSRHGVLAMIRRWQRRRWISRQVGSLSSPTCTRALNQAFVRDDWAAMVKDLTVSSKAEETGGSAAAVRVFCQHKFAFMSAESSHANTQDLFLACHREGVLAQLLFLTSYFYSSSLHILLSQFI